MSIRAPLALLFLVSGFTGLVLQTVWTRMMILVFGSTTFAVSTVLTAFMAGLAGGSWLAGRMRARLVSQRRAVAVYGVLELGIGLYALALPWLLGMLPALQEWVHGEGAPASFYVVVLLRFVVVTALLAPPTLAMGATLPVLARAFCREGHAPQPEGEGAAATGRDVGTLYALNTAGAVVGVFTAGFLLLPAWGTSATNLTACGAGLLLGGAALLLSRRWPAGPGGGGGDGAPAPRARPAPRSLLATVALCSIAVSGAVAMALEVALTRALSLVIGSSTYAFSLILLCFLVGLAAGAALYARRQTAAADQAGNLAVAHLLVAASVLAGVVLMDDLPAVLLVALKQVTLSPRVAFALKFSIVGLVVLLPTLFMGMVFPAVLRIYAGRGGSPTETTATVYSTNTLGAIAGSFLGGYALVPLLGLQRAIEGLALASLLLAAVLAAFARGRLKQSLVWACAAVLAAAPWLLSRWDLQAMNAGVFRVSRYEQLIGALGRGGAKRAQTGKEGQARRQAWVAAARGVLPAGVETPDTGREATAGTRMVYHREGLTATVGISRTVDRALARGACWVRHTLLVNGKPDASLSVLDRRPPQGCAELLDRRASGPGLAVSPAGDAETQVLSGVLPTLIHRGRVRDALVIGWGSGVTVGALRAAGVERVTAVELEARVVEASRFFEPANGTPRVDRGVRIVSEDGRNFVARQANRYDLVISEPSNPWMAGCGNLFTQEFFQLVRRRLAPDGVLLQWLQAYEIAPANVWTILATVASVFESVHVVAPVRPEADLLLVARRDRGRFDWGAMSARIGAAGARLSSFGIRGPADVAARVVAGPRGVRRLGRGAELNTDDNARIEFATPRDLINYRSYSARSIIARMRSTLSDPLRLFSAVPRRARGELCWALLAAGRQGAAEALGADLPKCARAARILGRPLPALDVAAFEALGERSPGLKRIGRLPRARRAAAAEALLTPTEPTCATFGLLGRLHAADDEQRLALLFLRAALSSATAGAGPGCRPSQLRRALARIYHRVGLHGLALEHARQVLDE